MKLDLEQKKGLVQLISYTINNRVNDEATDLSYMELLNLKNELQKEEEQEVEDSIYTLVEDGINVRGADKVFLNEKIRNEDLHEYYIVDRKEFVDELIRWISEATNDKELMKQDLKMLIDKTDDYMLSSNSTNDYIFEGDSSFDETCQELIELSESLDSK